MAENNYRKKWASPSMARQRPQKIWASPASYQLSKDKACDSIGSS